MNLTDIVMSGPLLLALPIAVAAGLISFVSPCCLPLVPGVVSYVTGMAGADQQRAGVGSRSGASATKQRVSPRGHTVAGTALFVLGFAALFTSYGALFGGLGSLVLRQQGLIVRVLGVFTIGLGLLFVGAFNRFSFAGRTVKPDSHPRTGLVGAPLMGVMFGLGWTPCIGPTLAAVLTLSLTSGSTGRGAILAFAYSLGLGIPFLLFAVALSKAMRVFGFFRRHARTVMRAGGGMLIVLGLLEVTGLWLALISRIQGWVASFQPPL